MSREDFNLLAKNWDDLVDHDRDKIARVISELPFRKDIKVLDVGSGTGILIPFLLDHYQQEAEITEMDFSEKMIEKARKKFGNTSGIRYLIGDIYHYPFREEKFDLIICYSVFPHFRDQQAILKRFKSLLKGDGMLIIFHSEAREEINRLHREKEEFRTDILPPAMEVVDQAVEMGYRVERATDDSELYLIRLRNSSKRERS